VSESSVLRRSIVTVRFFLLLVAILQLCKSHTEARGSHEARLKRRDGIGMLKDGDYNPGQLRPVVGKVQMEETRCKDTRCITIRDLLKRRKEQRQWSEAPAFCLSGRLESGEVEDWVEPSTVEVERDGMGKAGGYLQRLNVWRQRPGACTTAGSRLIGRLGRRGGGMAFSGRRGDEWPRNRRPGEVNNRFANDKHPDQVQRSAKSLVL
jgi:hypothetical protein